jgi:hypothetical protein
MCTAHPIFFGDQTEEEIEACSMYKGERRCRQGFNGKT